MDGSKEYRGTPVGVDTRPQKGISPVLTNIIEKQFKGAQLNKDTLQFVNNLVFEYAAVAVKHLPQPLRTAA